MKEKIAVGIVVYKPKLERLEACISSVIDDVDRVYIYQNDNTPLPMQKNKKVLILNESRNLGLAYALNRIMEEAKKEAFQWVVTLDQDSIMPEGLIKEYQLHLGSANGILCPQVIDKRRVYMRPVRTGKILSEVDMAITSGSCTSISAWDKVGGFDQWLFIDLIDNEFCKRLRINGFKILRLNQWVLDQEFGKILPKSRTVQRFWLFVSRATHNQNFAKFSYTKFVDPNRVYYTNRNIIYVNKKLKNYGPVAYENYNCKSYFGFIFAFMIPSVIRAKQKKAVLKATYTGIIDGMKARVTEYKENAV